MKRLKYYEAETFMKGIENFTELTTEDIAEKLSAHFQCSRTEAVRAINMYRFQTKQFNGMTTGSINANK